MRESDSVLGRVEEKVCVCKGEERGTRKEKREKRDGKRWFSVCVW
jgi:hypothetical protein